MSKIKELENKLKEVKKNEKRIKLLKQLIVVVQQMNKLNGGFDLTEILENDPKFTDDFYYELQEVIKHIEESNRLLLED